MVTLYVGIKFDDILDSKKKKFDDVFFLLIFSVTLIIGCHHQKLLFSIRIFVVNLDNFVVRCKSIYSKVQL